MYLDNLNELSQYVEEIRLNLLVNHGLEIHYFFCHMERYIDLFYSPDIVR